MDDREHSPEAETLLDTDEYDAADTRYTRKGQDQFWTLEYWTFLVIGLSYLWPFNCFLAASAYFNQRFEGHEWLRSSFGSFMMSVTTVTTTVASLILADRQNANYSKRIFRGEVLMAGTFVVVSISCLVPASAFIYFMFIMLTVFLSALGCAWVQNGSFAVVNNFEPIHTQAIMVGQAVSGILPPIISLISALASGFSDKPNASAGASAGYFIVATIVAGLAQTLYSATQTRHKISVEAQQKPHYSLRILLKQLYAPAFGVFSTFAITLMTYPVFANNVLSVNKIRQSVFIPTAYLLWNTGDLAGRVVCAKERYVIKEANTLIGYGTMRLLFIPAFFLCNIRGTAALIESDTFYLLLLFMFGLTNGHLSSSSLISSAGYAKQDQKEATGGFMTLMLSLGLAAGSVLSFLFVALV